MLYIDHRAAGRAAGTLDDQHQPPPRLFLGLSVSTAPNNRQQAADTAPRRATPKLFSIDTHKV